MAIRNRAALVGFYVVVTMPALATAAVGTSRVSDQQQGITCDSAGEKKGLAEAQCDGDGKKKSVAEAQCDCDGKKKSVAEAQCDGDGKKKSVAEAQCDGDGKKKGSSLG